MVFTKREKAILAATIVALCVLALDFYVLTPLLNKREDVRADQERLLAEMARAGGLLERRRLLGPKWRSMVEDGMRPEPAEAESRLLRFLRDLTAEAGVELSSLRPDRSVEESKLPEITVHVAGTGSMTSVSRLLWGIETSRLPVKVKMLQLGSRKDGTDDLSLQLRASTLYCPPRPSYLEPAADGNGRRGGDR